MDLRIKLISKFIKKTCNKKIYLDDLSRTFGISSCYLSFLFKEETGMTLSEFQKSIRMRHAKALLRRSLFEIKEISFRIGYKSLSQFYRDFKSNEKVTPSEYRARYEKSITRIYSERLKKNANESKISAITRNIMQ